MCAITAGMKKYNSIIKKKQDKTVLPAKSTLHSIEILISKALIDSNICPDNFFLMNNALIKYDDMKE